MYFNDVRLDNATLMFCIIELALLATSALIYAYLVHRDEPALKFWLSGFIAMAVGMLLTVFGPDLPDLFPRVLANGCLALGAFMLAQGFVIFTGNSLRLNLAWGVTLIVLLGSAYWTYIEPSLAHRIILLMFSMVIAGVIAMAVLLVAARTNHRMIYLFLAFNLGLAVLAILVRTVIVWRGDPMDSVFSHHGLQTIWYLGAIAFIFICPLLLSLLTGQKLQQKLDYFANHDELTGLLNRRGFYRRLDAFLSARTKEPMTLVLLDLDHFKGINDRYGHAAGDLVLRTFATGVSRLLRRDDLLARLGGDEFSILLVGLEGDQADVIIRRISRWVQTSKVRFGTSEIEMGVSFGVAFPHVGTRTTDQLMSIADGALYQAKARRA